MGDNRNVCMYGTKIGRHNYVENVKILSSLV